APRAPDVARPLRPGLRRADRKRVAGRRRRARRGRSGRAPPSAHRRTVRGVALELRPAVQPRRRRPRRLRAGLPPGPLRARPAAAPSLLSREPRRAPGSRRLRRYAPDAARIAALWARFAAW